MATWKTSLLWCLLFVNSADDLFLEWNASATIRSSPVCQATVFIVFQYFTDICGYNYGQTTVLLKVKDTWYVILRRFAHIACVLIDR